MKKAFDQTVRDLKREVNKKVLKVPGIEQKILDATSNEPWGPHGSLLADIAHASRNYHEYQIIMHVIWKRLNDTGKNWRHVYKALTVLDYLIGHGSERVIDDIREHAYQISTLSDFQYIDSSGRDQGSNVRRKSQSLVSLVNDKERIQEVRQKAAANKDKYRSSFATGGRGSFSGSGGYGDHYDDDRSEGRYRDVYEGRHKDEDRNGYGRERDWGSRDDEKDGRGSDAYSSRDGDRNGRDSDERYGRDNYRDDDHRGGRGGDDSQFGPRNRSFDRDRDRFSEEDDRYSSRHNGGQNEEPSQDERRLERKLSEQSPPPSYDAAVKDDRAQDGKGVGNGAPPETNAFSPPAAKTSSPASASMSQYPNQSAAGVSVPAPSKGADEFDEFDPRGSIPAAPAPASGSGIDLFGSESTFDPANTLALVPVSYTTTTATDVQVNSGVGTNFVPLSSASTELSQPSENLFGDGPFKATGQENFNTQTPAAPTSAPLKVETAPDFGFGAALGGLTYTPTVVNGYQQHFYPNPQPITSEFPMANTNSGFVPSQAFPTNIQTSDVSVNYHQQPGPSAALAQQATAQPQPVNYHQQPGPSAALAQQVAAQPQPGPFAAQNLQVAPMTIVTQQGLPFQAAAQTALSASGAQPPRDKFETKSTVWTDTLSRGLVNLNISGAKVNPLADIGVDFDAINRMDRRNVKISAAAPATSTITMGKAMGSGSGIGRAGASSVAPPPNPMMGPTMAMGRGMGMGMAGNGMGMAGNGMGMGLPGYGMGMNQQPMGMGMGMNQGAHMQNPGYNPGMGMGGYDSQQPYGGGYR